MFLGRTWITDIIQSYGHVKNKLTAIPETIGEEVANATYLYLLNALGVEVSPCQQCAILISSCRTAASVTDFAWCIQ